MRRLVKNKIFLAVLAVWLCYWPVTLFIEHAVLIEVISGMVAAISAGVFAAYIPGAWSALRKRPYMLTGADLLLLGIVTVQLSITVLFIWSWSYRFMDTPQWMQDHEFRGWIVYLLFIGNALHMLAWDVEEKHHLLPTKSWVRFGMIVALGLAVGVMLLVTTGR